MLLRPDRDRVNPSVPDLIAQGAAIVEAGKAAGTDPMPPPATTGGSCREVYVIGLEEPAMADIREGAQASYDYLFGSGWRR